ncbi:Caldesmon [Helicobacter bizzozeronii]|nr:Caldesmon [Helicobacter bizzozeronii]
MNDTITCPHCAHAINIKEVLSKQAQQEFSQQMAQEKQRFEQELNQKRQEWKKAFEDLNAQKHQLETQQKNIEAKEKALTQQIQQSVEHALQQERTQAQAQIEQARQQEREKASTELEKKLEAQYELKLQQKDLQIEGLRKAAQEVQKKAEITSQQLQGEVQELAIEAYLRAQFPLDTIKEVKKGHRGGDCVQIVNDFKLQDCGIICYESKRTKDFNEAWIEKFKQDIHEVGAHIGILVTEAMPKSPKPMEHGGLYKGVYVCTFQEFKLLCGVLRQVIINQAWAQKSQENKSDKVGELYDYLMSPQFAKEVENVLLTFEEMKKDLEKEKQAMERIWAKRAKQIERIATITARTRGSIEGIAGSAIAPIPFLELGTNQIGME